MNICNAPCPVVFDLDGTLIDSAPDIHAAVNATLRDAGIAPLPFDRVRGFVGRGVPALWQQVVEATRSDPAQTGTLISGFMNRYHTATALTKLYPGVLEALGILADRGHPLGVCTNKPLGPTSAVLDHFGITRLFGVIIGGDSIPGHRKPDPEPLLEACKQLGAHPAKPHAIYVGDSEVDAQCAASVPLPLLLFTNGYRKQPVSALPHYRAFDHFEELPALVEALVMTRG